MHPQSIAAALCPLIHVMAQWPVLEQLPSCDVLRSRHPIPRDGGSLHGIGGRCLARRSQNGLARSCAEAAATCPIGRQIRCRRVQPGEKAERPQSPAKLIFTAARNSVFRLEPARVPAPTEHQRTLREFSKRAKKHMTPNGYAPAVI